MKKRRFFKLCLAACISCALLFAPVSQLPSRAAEVTVSGNVMSGTTSGLLLLSTPQGKMEIKIDNSTDTTSGKLLLPNQAVTVSVIGGNDGYLHASKISTGSQAAAVTVDTKNTAVINGKLNSNTKDNDLHFDTPQGEMVIKLDSTTSMGGCAFLVIGGSYSVTCGRGSDAYMHAISIADAAAASSGTPSSGSLNGDNSAYMSVSGTVSDRTTNGKLYLSTNEGTMQFIIDNSANTSKGMMLVPDRRLTVYFYHGSDAYLHAVTLVGEKSSSSATVYSSSAVSVSGTVNGKSTEDMLYLDTAQGRMEIKLDAVGSLNNCKVLTKDQRISVSCASGSDAYLHAVSITAL
ncbi:MAG: hypothetical protein Q4C65_09630 [Eubacteriales bacterium]|nr:hypothetical protein [Eubacteriales bacterium]